MTTLTMPVHLGDNYDAGHGKIEIMWVEIQGPGTKEEILESMKRNFESCTKKYGNIEDWESEWSIRHPKFLAERDFITRAIHYEEGTGTLEEWLDDSEMPTLLNILMAYMTDGTDISWKEVDGPEVLYGWGALVDGNFGYQYLMP